MKVCINSHGHMTKMAVNNNNLKKVFFRTRRPMVFKLGMKHQGMEVYKICINYDPGMTLTYFTARSTKVAHAFEWRKLLKCYLKGKACSKLTNGLNFHEFKRH